MSTMASNPVAVEQEDVDGNVHIKMEVDEDSSYHFTRTEDVQQTLDPEATGIVKGEQLDHPQQMEEVNRPSSYASSAVGAVPAPARTKLEDKIHRIRIIVQRAVNQKLSKGTPLTEPELEQLAEAIRQCERFSADAKPYLEKWKLTRAIRHVLKYSTLLPDYLPPNIETLLSAWARDEYNLVTDADNIDDESSVSESESDAESEDEELLIGRGSAYRGIDIKRSATGRHIRVVNKAAQRRSDIFGHNGLRVGSWWPMQLCALRDGAHGSKMGGIAGKKEKGAYSIVISGGGDGDYDDRDLGDVVWYSGSGDSRKEDQPLTNANQALIRSFSTQLPVRVIRSARAHSDFAPSDGFRYDGLYKVAWYGQVNGPHGHQIWRFKMVRLPDQPPIRREVPTWAELRTLQE